MSLVSWSASSISSFSISRWADTLNITLNLPSSTAAFQVFDDIIGHHAAISPISGICLLNSVLKCRIILNEVIGQIIFRNMMENSLRLPVSGDDDILLFRLLQDVHGLVLEFFHARKTH